MIQQLTFIFSESMSFKTDMLYFGKKPNNIFLCIDI
jgi:hypothetical protein